MQNFVEAHEYGNAASVRNATHGRLLKMAPPTQRDVATQRPSHRCLDRRDMAHHHHVSVASHVEGIHTRGPYPIVELQHRFSLRRGKRFVATPLGPYFGWDVTRAQPLVEPVIELKPALVDGAGCPKRQTSFASPRERARNHVIDGPDCSDNLANLLATNLIEAQVTPALQQTGSVCRSAAMTNKNQHGFSEACLSPADRNQLEATLLEQQVTLSFRTQTKRAPHPRQRNQADQFENHIEPATSHAG